MQLLTRNNLQLAAYGLFIVVVMLLPLFMDVFWLNRISKYRLCTWLRSREFATRC